MSDPTVSPIEYEIGADGKRTGRKRARQFADAYAETARTGLWPKDRAVIDAWTVPFR